MDECRSQVRVEVDRTYKCNSNYMKREKVKKTHY